MWPFWYTAKSLRRSASQEAPAIPQAAACYALMTVAQAAVESRVAPVTEGAVAEAVQMVERYFAVADNQVAYSYLTLLVEDFG